MSSRKGLNRQLFWLYEGHGRGPYLFRLSLLIFDVIVLALFYGHRFRIKGMPS